MRDTYDIKIETGRLQLSLAPAFGWHRPMREFLTSTLCSSNMFGPVRLGTKVGAREMSGGGVFPELQWILNHCSPYCRDAVKNCVSAKIRISAASSLGLKQVPKLVHGNMRILRASCATPRGHRRLIAPISWMG